jgi:hypothetical protein
LTALPKVDARPKSLDPTSISTLFATTTRVFNHQETENFLTQKQPLVGKITTPGSIDIMKVAVIKILTSKKISLPWKAYM